MYRIFFTFLFVGLPFVASAQASGGQIHRPTVRTEKVVHPKNISQRAHMTNSQVDNRPKRAILINCGVPSATIYVDNRPYNSTTHLLSFGVHQVKIIADGYEDFEQSITVNNDISPNYSFRLQPSLSLIPKEHLAEYNVIVSSFQIFANAKNHCEQMKNIGYNAYVYQDSNGIYRVIAGSFSDKSDALNCWALLRSKGYPDTWIMRIENGQESRYR